jgi:hypothetical protein
MCEAYRTVDLKGRPFIQGDCADDTYPGAHEFFRPAMFKTETKMKRCIASQNKANL